MMPRYTVHDPKGRILFDGEAPTARAAFALAHDAPPAAKPAPAPVETLEIDDAPPAPVR